MKIFYEQIKDEGLALESSFSFSEGDDVFEVSSFSGRIDRTGDVYTLTGVLSVKFSSLCDRCLEPMSLEFQEELTQAISPLGEYPEQSGEEEDGLTDQEAGMYVTPRDHFDLDEFLREEALLLTPEKRICSEDCKGICEGCGAMLNKENCKCGVKGDFKWSALDKLKNN